MMLKKRETYTARVIDTISHQDGKVVDIFLEKPKDLQFESSDGIGIPASLSASDFSLLKSLLANDENVINLLPQNGLPGPNFAFPSKPLLTNLLSKSVLALSSHQNNDKSIEENTLKLKRILDSADLIDKLQANYTVIDLLQYFPKILCADDIIECQPPEHGNKTYTVDGRASIERKGTPCFRLNITRDDGPAYRALFGEKNPEGFKKGQASSYLRSLKIGDLLTINTGIKSGPQIPVFRNRKRPIILVSQGNSLIRMLSILEEIRIQKAQNKSFGSIFLVSAFRSKKEVLEIEKLSPYLNDGTLSELHLCLSTYGQSKEFDHDLITVHEGTRVQNIFKNCPFCCLKNPFVLLSGGEKFCTVENSVGQYLADRFNYDFQEIEDEKKTHKDMRISKSPNRCHSLQGKKYTALSVPKDISIDDLIKKAAKKCA